MGPRTIEVARVARALLHETIIGSFLAPIDLRGRAGRGGASRTRSKIRLTRLTPSRRGLTHIVRARASSDQIHRLKPDLARKSPSLYDLTSRLHHDT